MLKLFSKSCLIAALSLGTMNFSLMAGEFNNSHTTDRAYIGAFGGGLHSNSYGMSQMGTTFFTEASGGPLAIDALGNTQATWSGFGGVHIGYEWRCLQNNRCSCWNISPAVELEGFWYSQNKKAHLINSISTDRDREQDFSNTFNVDAGVYLANAVFALNHSTLGALYPYLGLGIGATRLSLKHATSFEASAEEAGINHFNSQRNDSSWAFAAQVKAGLRYHFCESFHIFGEYRYLFVDSSNYILGSTSSTEHPPTSPWNVKINNMQYNAVVFGIQYDL